MGSKWGVLGLEMVRFGVMKQRRRGIFGVLGRVDRGLGFLVLGVGILYPYIPSRARVIGFSFKTMSFNA